MPIITKLLVANRGEIAARIMRTARQLDVATVAVFSDADAGAPFVRAADEAVPLPGLTPAETYLQAERIIAAARRTGADAVHPGYGFLSENAAFARAVLDAGLIWVGPPPAAIETMGSKIAAKVLMASAGVPVLPGITVGDEAEVREPCLNAQAANEIGYPVLVKAVFGGGGRGMRVVRDPAELAGAVGSARREAAAAFGDGTVFLERYVDAPRHVEVQIFGDTQGNVVHLFERECSIQRRYQKIIEEAPSPAVGDDLRRELGEAAVAAGKAIGYTGAGTVEFILDGDGEFFFLEVNTRLQVEHPVTELVTGLDLVALQLAVAEGQPLPDAARFATLSGHAVEARLYAEDVAAGFLPGTGTVDAFEVPGRPGVRVDAGVAAGQEISVHYDPMLAKVIAWGATRDEACRRLARALADTRLHGVVSNRELLVGILREPEFRSGAIDTGYLTHHDPAELARSWRDDRAVPLHALAAALAAQAERRSTAPVQPEVPSGWRNVISGSQHAEFTCDGQDITVRYLFTATGVDAQVEGGQEDACPVPGLRLRSASAGAVVADVDGVRREFAVHRVGGVFYVDSALGSTRLAERPRFPEPGSRSAPGSLLAPMPGTVARIAVTAGQAVRAGAPVVVLEAMKMEHTVPAPHDGIVTEIGVRPGQTVDTGIVLALVEEAGAEEAGAEEAGAGAGGARETAPGETR
jgi:acetyl/propionyl-CoA carboxylase alpha subunit